MKIIRTTTSNSLAKDFAKPLPLENEIESRNLIAVEELLQFMKREGIKRSELAERMGVSPSRITAMLSGDSNLTIDTLVRAGHAVGAELEIRFQPATATTSKTASKVAEDSMPYQSTSQSSG